MAFGLHKTFGGKLCFILLFQPIMDSLSGFLILLCLLRPFGTQGERVATLILHASKRKEIRDDGGGLTG